MICCLLSPTQSAATLQGSARKLSSSAVNRTATGAQAPTAIAALSILPSLIDSRAAVMAIEMTRYRRAPSFSNPSACKRYRPVNWAFRNPWRMA